MIFSHHLANDKPEHPFAEFIRILGKGKKGARSLTQEEACRAMTMIMANEILPEQLGAFLMLLRIKEETAEEIAGFVLAARKSCLISNTAVKVDLDWSSYAGKRRHLPWFLLSALLLAQNGITVFMHGAPGPSTERLYTENVLPIFGFKPAQSLDDAKRQLQDRCFSYLNLVKFCPRLHEIIDLRPVLGLRSPVHTLVRMLNPFNAGYSIQGIFHPSYRAVHQQAALLLQQPHMNVLKGEGGETERNPDMECLVQSVHDGEMSAETWPAVFTRRHVKAENLEPQELLKVWQGKKRDEFGEASVIGTLAVVLKLLQKTDSRTEAGRMAANLWAERDLAYFG